MTQKQINHLKNIYDVDKNDGKIRNIVFKATNGSFEYTRIMQEITN